MMPDNMTKPIMAITLTDIPEIQSASRPPVNASGTVNIMINGERRDWNCATMIRYMNTRARASILNNSVIVSLIVSSSPVISTSYPSGTSYFFRASLIRLLTRPILSPSLISAVTDIYRLCEERLIDCGVDVSLNSATSESFTSLVVPSCCLTLSVMSLISARVRLSLSASRT